jgi:iron complex outermembrane recepter protein
LKKNRSFLLRGSAIGAVLAAAGFVPGEALSQTTAATQKTAEDAQDDRTALAEIVVTAERRQADAQKVPISVSAFSEKDLERLSINEPKNLQFATPGLIFPDDNATINPYIRGRGYGFSGSGLEGSVAIYIDDVYMQSQFGVSGLLDMAQVQVLKGPQGTLYGRNATGGAIVFTTNDPTDKLEGYAEAGYGNLGMWKTEAVLNLPVSDTLALRFAGRWNQQDGILTNDVDGEKQGGPRELEEFRVKALWKPSENFSALLKGEYQESHTDYLRQQIIDGAGAPTGLQGGYETVQSPVNPVSQGGENRTRVSTTDLRLAYQTDAWALTNTTGYRDTHLTTCGDDDNVYPVLDEFCFYTPVGDPRIPQGADGAYDHTLTDELRFTSSVQGPVNFAGGLNYQHSTARTPGIVKGALFGPLEPFFDNYTSLNSKAVYAEAYFEIVHDLKLTLGGRYSKDDKGLRVINNADVAPAFGIPPALLPVTFSQAASFSDFTPRAVLAYDVGNANYYVSYNKGFKSGGFNAPAFLPQTPLRPETIEGFELGYKAQFLENRLRFNVAAFSAKSSDVQVASIDPATDSVVQQNAAGVQARGVEADLSMVATRSLTFQIGSALLHSRFTSFPDAASYSIQGGLIESTQRNLAGFPTVNSPDFTANANATYAVQLPQGWSASFTLAGRYSSSYDFTPGAGGLGYDRQRAFTVADFTGQIMTPGGRLSLSWYVDNLTQRYYYDMIQTNANFGVYTAPALPRTYGALVRYSF